MEMMRSNSLDWLFGKQFSIEISSLGYRRMILNLDKEEGEDWKVPFRHRNPLR